MRSPSILLVCVAALGAGCAGQLGGSDGEVNATAAGSASSKATAAIHTVTVCANNSSAPCQSSATTPGGVWQDVMTASLTASATTSLFVDTSLVTGLFTSTTVKGNGNGSTSSATAMAGVSVRVLIDGKPGLAYPDTTGAGITFDDRVQTLTANLGNIFTDCFANGGSTGTGCTLTPEQITLALDTSSAHAFAFIVPSVGTGTHEVRVQAQVNTAATGSNGGVAISNALYGLGSLTVQAVRLVNTFSF